VQLGLVHQACRRAPKPVATRNVTTGYSQDPPTNGVYWGNPKTRTFGELLIDCEEDWTLRTVLVGMLREVDRRQRSSWRSSIFR
jgi:hypothetical protein